MESLNNCTTDPQRDAAKDFITFVDKCPSPYHVVAECRQRLEEAGFIKLDERDSWNLKQLGKYYCTRNSSSLTAFVIGGKYQAGNGASIISGHTDSPCFKVKPTHNYLKHGYRSLGVSCYGGGLWHTWFDRDLTIAGKIIVKDPEDRLSEQLIHVKQPILRIPSLCSHLQTAQEREVFSPNKETHTLPVLATDAISNRFGNDSHLLAQIIKKELLENSSQSNLEIIDFDLCLADTQPSAIGGVFQEFIFAPRLDNLVTCYTGIQGLIGSLCNLDMEQGARVLALFDNEEVGSESFQGAASTFLEATMRRISRSTMKAGLLQEESNIEGLYESSIAKSFHISSDQAHAVHPNYSEKHEWMHQPDLHNGVVLKRNVNQKYASSAETCALLKEIAKQVGVPMQPFVVANDKPCGTTVGPIIARKLGVRTVDVGGPMLSMHSIREMCGVTSITQLKELFKGFYQEYTSLESKCTLN